ncbi:histone deacetylase family protein [Desulfonema magnum]|uniref:Histone deacetylase family protein n=1 Tax=Desulfonema magnum TaxID=45655 RepID=A0A975GRG9_9BACT|nr:histone deacetylase family protein [Desulfonema magnum]QTA90989.1 Histone deacetylase family protein [Desulfonema magnum]
MKVIFHEDFYQVYTSDPASVEGRMEAVVKVIQPHTEFVTAVPASDEDIAAVHTEHHMDRVRRDGLYDISALAAGGAIQAATAGLTEPCFGLIRPPGHHASSNSCWGFCYFNNMAIALEALRRKNKIQTAYVLDIDLHYGDGNVNILGRKDYVTVHNVEAHRRDDYMDEVTREMEHCHADIIGISAGFDNHEEDWGGLLTTEDYLEIGLRVREAARQCDGGCFAILEGGYNHKVLGHNVLALVRGLSGSGLL